MAPYTVSLPGLAPFKLFTHERGDAYISRQIEQAGFWEPLESSVVAGLLKPGDVFVDLGANIGYYTVLAAQACGPRGKVYAFEPEPSNIGLLNRNVALNGLGNVTIVDAAASNSTGFAELYLSTENQGDHRLYDNEQRSSHVRVREVALDEWFSERDNRVDFVKMDTQGSEARIIDGMLELISANWRRMRMIVEFWPFGLQGAGDSAAVLVERLRRFDWTVYKLDESLPQQVPTSWDELLVDAETVYHPSTRHFTNLLLAPRQ